MREDTEQADEAIVARVTSGETDAYAILMQRYEQKLLRYVTYLIHDQFTARDVVQETFIKAYQNLRGFNPKYRFSPWIYRIAHNEAMNALKKSGRHPADDIDTLPDVSYDARLDELLDVELVKHHVNGCLSQLEPKYREVVQLVYFEGMKYEDVSDVLHLPVSTVGVWLSRAKAKLKQICEAKGVKK